MNIDDFSFHDADIIEVKETSHQILDFLIEFPIDWDNNIFEKRILRFNNVISYLIEEIPFGSQLTILQIKNLGEVKRSFGTQWNHFDTSRQKIVIQTNAGNRTIEFSDCEFIPIK